MSKAILVVDVPDNLRFKELFVSGEIRYTINSENRFLYLLKEIDRCKLKPLPERKPHIEEATTEALCNDAWNACIDEILGGNN